MLKTVSSISNAIGALNYKGTWNASTNSPALSSGVGTKGDYYVVSTAGSTTLDGISNWGVGDWAAFNGSVWQRVEGGADLNGVNLSVSGTSTLSGLTASTALALNASKEVVSVTNTGTGNNVLASAPTFTNGVTVSTGNLAVTSGKTFSLSGNVSTTSGVAASLFTVGSGEIYLVSIVQDNGDGNVFWTGTCTGRFNTSITNITAIASAFLTAGASGTNFQITQSTGTARSFNWFALRLCGI